VDQFSRDLCADKQHILQNHTPPHNPHFRSKRTTQKTQSDFRHRMRGTQGNPGYIQPPKGLLSGLDPRDPRC